MKNIPFPNPHDADALNDYLDALAAGKQVSPEDEVQATAANVQMLANREMPSIPEHTTGVHTGGETVQTAAYSPPISNRTRRARAATPKKSHLEPWLSGLLVAGLLVSMIGYAWWNGPGGGDDNNNLAWAPGTAEPFEQRVEPLNPESAPWIADFDPEACTQTSNLNQVEINYEVMPEAQVYRINGVPDDDASEAVIDQYRAMRGCDRLEQAWAYWTDARVNEHPRALNEQNRSELAALQDHFAALYPQQFMAVATNINVSSAIRSEWSAREASATVGQPIPLEAKLNPDWAVQLADGRIAFPATTMYSADDPAIIANGIPVHAQSSPVVIIFALEDGSWKYDDSLVMCFENCEAGVGNPMDLAVNTWAESPDSRTCSRQLMQPGITYGSDLSELTYTDRSYEPMKAANSQIVDGVSPTVNTWHTCSFSGDHEAETQTYMTPLGMVNLLRLNNGGVSEPFVAAPYLRQWERGTHNLISRADSWNQVAVIDEGIRTTRFGMTWSPVISGSTSNSANVRSMELGFSPDTATQLKDGRIAMYAVPTISIEDRGAITYEGNRPSQQVTGIILQEHGDQWLIDEIIASNSGTFLTIQSDEWWWDSAFDPKVASSPAAALVLENEPFLWAAPISPKECPDDETIPAYDPDNPASTLYTQDDYDQVSVDRSYEIVGPAEPETAYAVVTRVRQSDACGNTGKNLPWISTRYEYENRTSAGRESLESIVGQRSDGSSTISSWYEDEMELTPTAMYVNQDPGAVELQGDESLEPTIAFNPDQAVEFTDGRIGIIPSVVSYDGEPARSEDSFPVYMLILVNQDGEWMLDEKLGICIGECPVPMATPAATPDT